MDRYNLLLIRIANKHINKVKMSDKYRYTKDEIDQNIKVLERTIQLRQQAYDSLKNKFF